MGALRNQLEAAPTAAGQVESRWTLRLIQATLEPFKSYSLSGIWRWLGTQKLHYKRGQQHMHSPDPNYTEKEARIQAILEEGIRSRSDRPRRPPESLGAF